MYQKINPIKTQILNNFHRILRALAAVALLGVSLDGGSALAKDFDARVQLDKRSYQEGLGTKSIELLTRLPGMGSEAMAGQLLERFRSNTEGITTQGEWKMVQTEKRYRTIGDGWRLRVWGDGTRFSYTNQTHDESAYDKAIPLEKRFTNETLEEIGREFIDTALKGWVSIGKGEELVPLYTEFEIAGGVSEDGKVEEEKVMASVIHFGRRIDGHHVVGLGSRISVYVNNDGEAYDFDVDWPRYERTGKMQEVLKVEDILKRLSEYGTLPEGDKGDEIKRFECGYFDGGLLNSDLKAPIQAGCLAYVVGTKVDTKNDVEITVSFLNDVPAGVEVEVDELWPETVMINNAN